MLVSVLMSKQCMIVWGLRQWRKDSSIIWRRGWRQMAHLRAWRSRGVGSGPLILGLRRGFGVGCGVSSSSAGDDDGSVEELLRFLITGMGVRETGVPGVGDCGIEGRGGGGGGVWGGGCHIFR